MITKYNVEGMTCEHCAKAVTEEVSAIAGVKDVNVDLDAKAMSVESDNEIEFSKIEAAVDEAGDYQVTKA